MWLNYQRDRLTNGQTNRLTNGQTDRLTNDTQIYKQMKRQRCRKMDEMSDRWRYAQMKVQTGLWIE